MRVVSQNGRYDLPYEKVCISLDLTNEKNIIAWDFSSDFHVDMAEYSSEEKARKAMQMCRDKYVLFQNDSKSFRFPDDEV